MTDNSAKEIEVKSKYDVKIDTFRGILALIALFAVFISGHIEYIDPKNIQVISWFSSDIFMSLCIPLMFVLSGYLFHSASKLKHTLNLIFVFLVLSAFYLFLYEDSAISAFRFLFLLIIS